MALCSSSLTLRVGVAIDMIRSSQRQFWPEAIRNGGCSLRSGLSSGRFSADDLVPVWNCHYQPATPKFMSMTPQFDGAPVGRVGRTALVVWSMLLLAGFAMARSLEPDPRGYGTHRQLGLPECTFRTLFSKPCPGCGMTTSFSHFVRGDLLTAGRVNPAGLLLAAVSALMIPWCLFSAVQGRLWCVDEPLPFFAYLVIALGGVSTALWAWRLWWDW
ncbi:MAG: DUF2752 domain-containing protein [Planctomycetales bacterium]|nr:DUF2752 domain-containing protein [Planctomycetales bacterium]